MKQLKCELCGSAEIIKQDGMFVCQECGTKYTLEEAKKMISEITDNADVKRNGTRSDASQIANLYTLARRAKDNHNAKSAQKYYEQILIFDPNDWEAYYFSAYFSKMNLPVDEIIETTDFWKSHIRAVMEMIKSKFPSHPDRLNALGEIKESLTYILWKYHDELMDESSDHWSIATDIGLEIIQLEKNKMNYTSYLPSTAFETMTDKLISADTDNKIEEKKRKKEKEKSKANEIKRECIFLNEIIITPFIENISELFGNDYEDQIIIPALKAWIVYELWLLYFLSADKFYTEDIEFGGFLKDEALKKQKEYELYNSRITKHDSNWLHSAGLFRDWQELKKKINSLPHWFEIETSNLPIIEADSLIKQINDYISQITCLAKDLEEERRVEPETEPLFDYIHFDDCIKGLKERIDKINNKRNEVLDKAKAESSNGTETKKSVPINFNGFLISIIALIVSVIPYISFIGVALGFLVLYYSNRYESDYENDNDNKKKKLSKYFSTFAIIFGLITLFISIIVIVANILSDLF